ncbi:hypothetical protein TTHT_0693 [Thermotomaculum hydrothermale]|uniref:GLPGLI family protein n=1 Tax=Thermotomaculum hydrothermale TaxID=981385 RepID=A0A7R6SYY2_9BACT|nr:hypothetical protein [Thermotomaculum hydrothermale]BBB32265.1 hypothetical protein TTHT_0693 [Thermotomaculum hydrothermale]
MKKAVFILFLCFSLLSFGKGYKITYKIYLSGSDKPYIETTIMCEKWMKISIDKNRYYLFQNYKGYIVDEKNKKAIEYDFNKNKPFFAAFVANYGITTTDGNIVFPQLIFKKTKKTIKVNKILARKYELPGNYLNSKSTAWFAENKLRYNGTLFAKYLSFFTNSKRLLNQAKNLNSFPLRIETVLQGGIVKDSNIRVLDKIEEINCPNKSFKIPSDFKIIKAKPQGLPVAEM